ncbi:hypothetical protein [Spirosoma oryzicola]|uniref:hypothetical protein n=1 Tax=Spirosoma oryzicola TaxID=2898794 RepID=UPI001E358733|nr:hypothetical protein [Spirosoma oryzicola]UHG94782.1 hypothetical protein LQ777_29000 [Spirosoma oryzicola]
MSIRHLLDVEFNALGYEYITYDRTAERLKKEYLINKKKVYRLMQEHDLFLGKTIRPTGKREFVQFRRIEAIKSLEYLCWNIKYVWPGRRCGRRGTTELLSVECH